MTKLALHRPLWFAAAAVSLVVGFDIFWFLTFIDMPRPQEELGDMAVRLSAIYGIIIAPTFLIAYALALCAVVLSLLGRGFHIRHYSTFSRIAGPLLCFGVFGFQRFALWRLIMTVHAARHPDSLNY